ncbi:unnamed protein product, partial [Polarella glacialis]
VLGTEGEGISPEMLGLADRAVFLPMFGFVQSLNVAVAGAMMLQRLFDLCPNARGDLDSETMEQLRAQAIGSERRFAHADDQDETAINLEEIS